MPEIEIQRQSEVIEIEERGERLNYQKTLDELKQEIVILKNEINKIKKIVKEG